MARKWYSGRRVKGLKTDTKPTQAEVDSEYEETDTGNKYNFDGTNWKFAGSGTMVSTETKPTHAETNATITETDTKTIFDYNGSAWVERVGAEGAVLNTTVNPTDTTIGNYTLPSSSSSSSVASPVTNGQTNLQYTTSCGASYNGSSFSIPASMNGKKIYRAGIKSARNNSSSWNQTLGLQLRASDGTVKGTFGTTHNSSSFPMEHGGMNGNSMAWVYWDVDTGDSTVGLECATGDTLKITWNSGSGNSIIYSATCAYNHTIDDQIQYIANHLHDSTISNESVTRTQAGIGEWVSFDIGSSAENQAIALHLDSGNTETEFKIQTSPDNSTWTTKRTILTSKLTADAWNYIVMNIEEWEYCRVLGSSGLSKIISFTGAKRLAGSSNYNHGHFVIDPDDTSLGLNGT